MQFKNFNNSETKSNQADDLHNTFELLLRPLSITDMSSPWHDTPSINIRNEQLAFI